jgi:hypothetical protein
VNHKVIGRRFMILGLVFFLVGGLEALLIRVQLARPELDFLGPDAFNQTFTMHGTTMMFLFIIPMIEGLAIYFVPLLIGTRDLPFPRLNAFSFWTLLFGGIFLHTSFIVRAVPDGGWFAYVPLTGPEFRPDLGLDFWLLGVTFVEIGAVIAAVELIVLILKQRAPGMSLNRMPLFVWSVLVSSFIILFAVPLRLLGALILIGQPQRTTRRIGWRSISAHLFSTSEAFGWTRRLHRALPARSGAGARGVSRDRTSLRRIAALRTSFVIWPLSHRLSDRGRQSNLTRTPQSSRKLRTRSQSSYGSPVATISAIPEFAISFAHVKHGTPVM